MKLCIIDQGEVMGGAELFTIDLLRYTSKSRVTFHVLHDKEAQHSYLKELDDIPFVKHAGISLPSMNPGRILSYGRAYMASKQIASYCKKHTIDCIQSNTVRSHVISSIAAEKTGIPLVWVLHDFTFPKKYLRRFAHVPQFIVCVSEAVRQFVLDEVPGIDAKKVVVIPNGVQTEKVRKSKPLEIHEDVDGTPFSFKEGVRYIGLIGRIDTWKGQDIFLKAIRILQKEYPQHKDVEYLIIGDTTTTSEERIAFGEQIKAYVRDNNLDMVHFLGRQPCYEVLHRLFALVHASTEPEPFGRTIIEAFAAGVPVIASKLGAPEHIISYGQTGLLFEPRNPQDLAQKISILLEDNHLVETLRMQASKEVRAKYHMEKVVEAFGDLWSRI